ncbi:MAG: hypothetical protein JW993_01240 [Sedimentisphaerales bacterium]|nr:hypothetical protein [Sedimentisphaerales bacterium]
MYHYKDIDKIPWTSMGRDTTAFAVGRSIVPVGIYPFDLVPFSPAGIPEMTSDHPDMEKFLMKQFRGRLKAIPGNSGTPYAIREDSVL